MFPVNQHAHRAAPARSVAINTPLADYNLNEVVNSSTPPFASFGADSSQQELDSTYCNGDCNNSTITIQLDLTRLTSVSPVLTLTIRTGANTTASHCLLACSTSRPTPVRPITHFYHLQSQQTRRTQIRLSEGDINTLNTRQARTLGSKTHFTYATTLHHPSREQIKWISVVSKGSKASGAVRVE